MRLELEALLALDEGEGDRAVSLLTEAAELEDDGGCAANRWIRFIVERKVGERGEQTGWDGRRARR